MLRREFEIHGATAVWIALAASLSVGLLAIVLDRGDETPSPTQSVPAGPLAAASPSADGPEARLAPPGSAVYGMSALVDGPVAPDAGSADVAPGEPDPSFLQRYATPRLLSDDDLPEPPPQIGWVSQPAPSTDAELLLEEGGLYETDDPPPAPVPSSVDAASIELELLSDAGRAAETDVWVGSTPVRAAISTSTDVDVTAAGTPLVRVDVVDSSMADQAGFDRVAMLVEVVGLDAERRADGVSADEAQQLQSGVEVGLAIDYSAFVDEFGADWAGRLRLVRFESCAFSPGDTTCPGWTVVDGFANDQQARVMSASIPLDELVGAEDGLSARSAAGTTSGFALLAGASSASGDYSTTSLNPSGSWAVGGQSGDFTWSYPVNALAPPAGGAPGVSVSYNSGTIDGLTADQNTQGGVLGPGWAISEGFIERSYKSCTADVGNRTEFCWSPDNQMTFSFGGMSEKLIYLSTAGAGVSGWEVSDYRMEAHTGWLVQRRYRTTSTVGNVGVDDNGEHWKVTSPDGTVYWFGYGSDTATEWAPDTLLNSVATVPVVGNHTGEPCNTFSYQWCHQAYRWSLDHIEDANGRVTTFLYTQDRNHYGINGSDAASEPYVAGTRLARIEYGQLRSGAVTPDNYSHSLVFAYIYRCNNPINGACPNAPTAATAGNFPDIPVDQFCSTASCTKHSPTFYTIGMLRNITQYVRDGAGTLLTVAQDVFGLDWADGDGAGSDPARLWLRTIQHTAYRPTGVTMPAIRIDSGNLLANRVDYNNWGGVTQMKYYRVGTITDEYGSQIDINYTQPKACPSPWPASTPAGWGGFQNNTWSCFARYWTPPSGPSGHSVWHKYVVDRIVQLDQVTPSSQRSPWRTWTYQYPDASGNNGGMAWHSDSNPLVPVAARSWGEYRGFERVRVVVGNPTSETNRVATETIYHRGMYGDINVHSGTAATDTDTTPSSIGAINDTESLAGRPRETIVTDFINGTNSPGTEIYSGTVTNYQTWTTAAPNGNSYYQVEKVRDHTRSDYGAGSMYGVVDYVYDSNTFLRRLSQTRNWGRVSSTYTNLNGPDGNADQSCTIVYYTPSSVRFPVGLPARSVLYASIDCSAGPMRDTRTFYDSQGPSVTPTSVPALVAPTYGNPTAVWQSTGGSGVIAEPTGVGTEQPAIVNRTAYGNNGFSGTPSWGRIASTTDARGVVTTYGYEAYGEALRFPTKTVTVTNALGQQAISGFDLYGNQTSTTTKKAAADTVPQTVSYVCYDGMHRATRVYEPGVPGGSTCTGSPSLEYTYHVIDTPGTDTPSATFPRWAIRTRQLFALDADAFNPQATGDSYLESWTLFDGYGRIAQTNQPAVANETGAPTSRVVVRTVYDTRDNVLRQSQPIIQGLSTGTDWWNGDKTSVPRENWTSYDAFGNPVEMRQLDNNDTLRTATNTPSADRVVSAPFTAAGSPTYASTTNWFDARGNTWKVTEHNNNGADRDTLYQYDMAGQLVEITDAGGNVTTMTYNWLGWRTIIADPNAGGSGTRYWPTGQVRHTSDANNQILFYRIDSLGRTATVHTALAWDNANKVAAYQYDGPIAGGTATGPALGNPTIVESYAEGVMQTRSETTAFNAAGDPTTVRYTVPAANGPGSGDDALGAPYTFTTAYTRNHVPWQTTLPAVAGSLLSIDETIQTTFNLHGLPERVSNGTNHYTEDIQYDAYGRPLVTTLGAVGSMERLELRTQYAIQDNRLEWLYATAAAGEVIQWDQYSYDAAGNPTRIVHQTDWDTETECFKYDSRQRLGIAISYDGAAVCPTDYTGETPSGPAPYADAYANDHLGRITNYDGFTRTHTVATPTTGCRYGIPAIKPHALAQSTGGGRTDTFTYNCNGAMTSQTTTGPGADTVTYTWDEQQRLEATTNNAGTTTNIYDTTNNRVVRIDPDGTRTLYLGPTEIRYDPVGDDVQVARTYGQTRRDFNGDIINYAVNHQGTLAAATDSDPATSPVRLRTLPYGDPRTLPNGASDIDDRNFLNQPDDPNTSTVYLNNRHYSPEVGVFVSVDPIAILGLPATLNPYIYSRANPLTLSDPSGLLSGRGEAQQADHQGGWAAAQASETAREKARSGSDSSSCSAPFCFLEAVVEGASNAVESTLGTAYDLVACRGMPALGGCPDGYEPTSWNESADSIDTLLTNPTQFVRACQAAGAVECIGQMVGNILVVYAGGRVVARIVQPRPGAAPQVVLTTEAASFSIDDILRPGGDLLGRAGSSSAIREVSGGLPEAQAMFTELTQGGTIVNSTYPGTLVRLPDGGTVGIRTQMSNSPGTEVTIDVNIPGLEIDKIKFNP